MHNTNCKKFKGEIEKYVNKIENNFESKVDRLFSSLRIRTCLNRTSIKKYDGYPAAHLLFVLILLPLLKIPSIHFFCKNHLEKWSNSKKDTFYRFKRKKYRWRTFLYQVITEIGNLVKLENIPLEEL